MPSDYIGKVIGSTDDFAGPTTEHSLGTILPAILLRNRAKPSNG